jgi:hypothetical protein
VQLLNFHDIRISILSPDFALLLSFLELLLFYLCTFLTVLGGQIARLSTKKQFEKPKRHIPWIDDFTSFFHVEAKKMGGCCQRSAASGRPPLPIRLPLPLIAPSQ